MPRFYTHSRRATHCRYVQVEVLFIRLGAAYLPFGLRRPGLQSQSPVTRHVRQNFFPIHLQSQFGPDHETGYIQRRLRAGDEAERLTSSPLRRPLVSWRSSHPVA